MKILLTLLLASVAFAAEPPSTPPTPEAELRRLTQENLDAIAPGNVDVWRRNLHDQMLHIDENGVVHNKTEILAELQPLPKGLTGNLRIDRFRMTQEGNVAVVTHEDLEHLDYHGQMLVSRWRSTDTWIKTAAGWKLLAEQTMAILEDPPATTLPAAQLCTYIGTYYLTPEITEAVRCTEGGLLATRTARPEQTWRPEITDVFFTPGRPRTRRIFTRDSKGAITGFVDRREGLDIRWTKQPATP